jgi:hypothetical protein
MLPLKNEKAAPPTKSGTASIETNRDQSNRFAVPPQGKFPLEDLENYFLVDQFSDNLSDADEIALNAALNDGRAI